jgi:DNA polymerase-4
LPLYVSSKALILETVKDLLFQEKMKDSVRLLGISISNLNNEDKKAEKLPPDKTIDVQLKLDF